MSADSSSIVYAAPHTWQLAQLSAALPALLTGDWSVDALHAMHLSGHQVRVLSSAVSGDVIGFAEYQTIVDECHLYNIAILQHRQQQGHGMTLLQAVLAEAKEQGLRHCLLEVRESNQAARRLYAKLGFAETGKRKDYYPPKIYGDAREAAVLYSLSW
ncbi:MAG: ribosomal protein S18-alanine N-acetyltransferase [Pseudomonadota bacterium]